MIINGKKTQRKQQNLRVEQSKGSSREKLKNNKKKNLRKTKPWHIFQLVANDCYSFCIE